MPNISSIIKNVRNIMRQDRGVSGEDLIHFIDHPTAWKLCESSILPGVFRAFRGSKLPRLVARPSGRNHRRGRSHSTKLMIKTIQRSL